MVRAPRVDPKGSHQPNVMNGGPASGYFPRNSVAFKLCIYFAFLLFFIDVDKKLM
jgi:hypothetical protein